MRSPPGPRPSAAARPPLRPKISVGSARALVRGDPPPAERCGLRVPAGETDQEAPRLVATSPEPFPAEAGTAGDGSLAGLAFWLGGSGPEGPMSSSISLR